MGHYIIVAMISGNNNSRNCDLYTIRDHENA